MHAIPSYRGNRPTNTRRPQRQDRLQYTAPQLANAQCKYRRRIETEDQARVTASGSAIGRSTLQHCVRVFSSQKMNMLITCRSVCQRSCSSAAVAIVNTALSAAQPSRTTFPGQ